MYMEAYSAVTYLGVHVLVDLCPVEHGSIVLVDVDSSQNRPYHLKGTCTAVHVHVPSYDARAPQFNCVYTYAYVLAYLRSFSL